MNHDLTIDIYKPRAGRVVFLDTETTGLDPATEELFEIAAIDGATGDEFVFHLEPLPEVVDRMHPKAAEVNRFHERTAAPDWKWDSPHRVADKLDRVLNGAHIVGAVPDFDARFLTAWYGHMQMPVPRWHYHLIDIESMAVGWLIARADETYRRSDGIDRQVQRAQNMRDLAATLPWRSDDLSLACGVEPVSETERHTALGDARWVMRWWNRLHGRIA